MAKRESPDQSFQLHYKSSATEWTEALPVGNGRLGAMVYGGVTQELLQLNEDSVWYGGPLDRTPLDAHKNLGRLRHLIRTDQHAAAETLMKEEFYATPKSMRHYEPLGNCSIEYTGLSGQVSAYHRALDVKTAQSTTKYTIEGTRIQRDLIASYPDNVLLLRHESSTPVRFVIRLDRAGEHEHETNSYMDSVTVKDHRIILHATPGGRDASRLCLALGIVGENDSFTVERVGCCLVAQASACVIAIAANTTFRYPDIEAKTLSQIDAALGQSWDVSLQRHRDDYTSLFGRMSLQMWPDASETPTDERLRDNRDPGLAALYHNYGRYLLISSSRDSFRPLPATLQGIWNPSFAPPWGSKYTININLQMNYWPASACSLFEDCGMPVVDLLERMAVRGRRTASIMYGCKGWCAHHNTDIWADTSPQDHWVSATVWPLGGVWLTIETVDKMRYQYDEKCHRRLFAVLEGCIEFLLDFLIPSSCGQYMVMNPSLSPENVFISKSGELGIFCEGSTMDTSLIRITFEQFLWSLDVLSIFKHDLRSKAEGILLSLPPLVINDAGRIQEWGLNDYEENEPGHRHISHLYGLYPGDKISPVTSPELADAAKKVLQRRAEHGGGHTGWSRAWLVNLHARLFDHEGSARHMDLLLGASTLPNLLDTHPPFQIDGNFGGCQGVLECLIQSTEVRSPKGGVVEIRLLPACPVAWRTGELQRVRVKQGWIVSFSWKDGIIQEPVHTEATDYTRLNAVLILPDGSRTTVPVS